MNLTFPVPIDTKTKVYAHSVLKQPRKGKASLVLPVDKVQSMLKEVLQNNKPDPDVSLYLIAILEYISTEILKVLHTA